MTTAIQYASAVSGSGGCARYWTRVDAIASTVSMTTCPVLRCTAVVNSAITVAPPAVMNTDDSTPRIRVRVTANSRRTISDSDARPPITTLTHQMGVNGSSIGEISSVKAPMARDTSTQSASMV